MGYWDLSVAQRAFLKRYMNIDEGRYKDSDEDLIPVLREDDPLGAMAAAARDKEAGDPGVEVREVAQAGLEEIRTLAANSAVLGRDRRTRILMPGETLRTGMEAREATLAEVIQTGTTALTGITQEGFEISLAFRKDGADPVLDEMAKSRLKAAELALNTAKDGITKALADLETLAVMGEQMGAEFRDAYIKAAAAAEQKNADLWNWGHKEAAYFDRELKAIRATAAADYRAAPPKVKDLTEWIEAARRQAIEEYDRKLRFVLDIIATLRETALALEKSWAERRWSLTPGERALTIEKLDAAAALAGSGKNLGALDAATLLAEEARVAINEIKGSRIATPSAAQGGPETPAISDQISAALKEIKACLGNDSYAKRRPTELAKMKKAFAKVQTDGEALTPPNYLAKMNELKTTILGAGGQNWDSFAGRAETQLAWDRSFELVSGSIENRIKALDKLVPDGGYKGLLSEDLARAGDLLKLEEPQGLKQDADAIIKTIQTKLAQYETIGDPSSIELDPAKLDARKAFFADQAAGVEAAQKLAAEKAEYEKVYAATMLKIEGFAQHPLVQDGPKAAEFKSLREQSESTEKLVEDGKSYATGVMVLKRAAERLRQLQTAGFGVSNERLGDIGKLWRSAIRNLEAGIVKLAKEIEAAVAGDANYAPQVAAVKKTMDEVQAFYQSAIFDAQATVLATSQDTAARKRAREEILRNIRIYLDFTVGSAGMKALATNEFRVTGIGTLILTRLREIQFEVTHTE